MVEEDLLLRPQNSLPIDHRQGGIRWDNDTNLAYVWIPDVTLNWHDISQRDDNPHPFPGMCPPPLLKLLISDGSTSLPNDSISYNKIKA